MKSSSVFVLSLTSPQRAASMRYFEAVLFIFLFSLLVIFHRHNLVSVDKGSDEALAQHSTGDAAISCGCSGKSTARDGREWIGKSASGDPASSTVVTKSSVVGIDPVPYMTSTISASPFHFTFQVNQGQKFIRLHFYPASYRGFEESFDLFAVKAGLFILLKDFSPTLTSGKLGVKYLIKEFCINVERHGDLNITFTPSSNHMAYAFVNGIEIISMPTGLYYTPDGNLGAPISGQNYRFHGIDNRTALEMVERLNIGGSFISSVEDFGMFRRWNADASYFQESGVSVKSMAPKLASASTPLFIAPPKVYQTSWKIAKSIQLHNFTWKIPVDLGFGYLVRLHFYDHDAVMTSGEQNEFSILINNQIAETRANVKRWSGGTRFPVYKDFVASMRGYEKVSECHIYIVLQSVNGSALGLLKGLEIFKLSNLDNCLGTPASASLKNIAPSKLIVRRFFSLFIQSNAFGTCMTIAILILSTTAYCLRIICEEKPKNLSYFSLFCLTNVIAAGMRIIFLTVNVVVYSFRKIWKDATHDHKDADSASTDISCLKKVHSWPSMAQLNVLRLREKSASGDTSVKLTRNKSLSKGEECKPYGIREAIGEPKPTKIEKPLEKGKKTVSGSQAGNGGLIFVDDSKLAFDLKDLMKSSAELLGKGSCGTTYKAMVGNGLTVAVKRLRDVIAGKMEFELHMKANGSIRHENVVALMAYYYSEDEKLIVYDHYRQGSVSSLLHGNRRNLFWDNRIKIALGAARGIAHLHEISSSAHGNIKASNIFLNSKQYGCVSEFGMATLFHPSGRELQQAGYQAPEVTSTGVIHQPSDVYSFGILLLELLTGKAPFKSSDDEGIDLVTWTQSVVIEEWTAEVFDLHLLKESSDNEEEMVKMLQIGMRCVTRLPMERPKMRDVVVLLEDIRADANLEKANLQIYLWGSNIRHKN